MWASWLCLEYLASVQGGAHKWVGPARLIFNYSIQIHRNHHSMSACDDISMLIKPIIVSQIKENHKLWKLDIYLELFSKYLRWDKLGGIFNQLISFFVVLSLEIFWEKIAGSVYILSETRGLKDLYVCLFNQLKHLKPNKISSNTKKAQLYATSWDL